MKTTLSLFLFVALVALSETLAVFLIFFQSGSDIVWQHVGEWIDFFVRAAAIVAILFAAYRGKNYLELKDLATTREKKISDLTAENIKLAAKVDHLEDEREELRQKNLRLQGDADQIHRTRG